MRAIVFLTLLLAASAAAWQNPSPSSAPTLAAAIVDPLLPHERLLPPNTVLATDDPRAAALTAYGFRIELDATTGRPQRAVDGRIPWIAGSGNGLTGDPPTGPERREQLFVRARSFVAEHGDLYRLDDHLLARDETGTVSFEDEELDVVRFAIVDGDLPVLGAGLVFVVRHGDLVYFGSSHAAPPRRFASAAPLVRDTGQAVAHVLTHAGLTAADVVQLPARRERFLLPELARDGLRHREVRAVRLGLLSHDEEWEGWVDAADGAVVAFRRAGARACAGTIAAAHPRVRGGVRPSRGDDDEVSRPLRYVDIGDGLFADRAASYDWTGQPAISELRGRYAEINCLSCQNPGQAYASANEDGTIEFGWAVPGGPDAIGNGTSTSASRTAYYHANAARDLAAKWLGGVLTFVDQTVEVQVNGINGCNAVWSGFALKFSRSSDDCRNTGEIRDVVAHEWGHALDDFDGTGISDRAMSEGVADILASFHDRNSCIADSLFVDPKTAEPSSRCNGVRDFDEGAPGLQHSPPTLTISNNDCREGVHCLGEIYGQAAWHLTVDMITGRRYGDGSPLAPALGSDRAWELSERFFMLSRPLAEVMDPTAAGLSLYDAYMLVDSTSTGNRPNAVFINDAFMHHELSELPTAPNGTPCGAPTAPVIGTTVVERGPYGEIRASLSWGDVDAESYRVLARRIGGGRDFRHVGLDIVDDDRGTYWATDTRLEAGESYEYLILGQGASAGCWSDTTARATVAVALPELRLTSHVESDPAPGGDDDGVLEPGEFFEIVATIAETGGQAIAYNVTATVTSLDDGVFVTAGPAVEFGTIPPLASVAGTVPFRLYIDPGHDCQGSVPLLLELESDEGCQVRALQIVLPAAACPTADRSDVRFVSAAITADDHNPSCSDGDLLLDSGEQVELLVTVENIGSAPASRVEVVLSTPVSEVLFASGSTARWLQPLEPGERVDLPFEILAGDLTCASSIPIAVEVRAPENLAPDGATIELLGETDVAGATVVWDFEAGAQGWSGDGAWSLSRLRSNPVDAGQSFFSGTADNQCSTLRSPEITLHPTRPSTLTLASWYELAGRFQAKYWDGVNLYVVRASGTELIEPVAGRGYDATLTSVVLCEAENRAWADAKSGKSWDTSTFDLGPFLGETIRLELHYSTDNRDTSIGFWLDDVIITNVAQTDCDANVCVPDPDCESPEMWLATPTNACVHDAVELQAVFDFFGQGVFDYEWDFGDGRSEVTTVPDAPVTHVYTTPGAYAPRLNAMLKSDPLCSASASKLIVVAPRPIADAGGDVDGPSPIGTPGFAGLDYDWSPALGLDDPTKPQPTADPTRTTEYCLSVSAPTSGCGGLDCVVVSVATSCGATTDSIADLQLVREDDDVVASWTLDARAVAYSLFRMDRADKIPASAAWNTTATLVELTAAAEARDASIVQTAPDLLFYQIRPECP